MLRAMAKQAEAEREKDPRSFTRKANLGGAAPGGCRRPAAKEPVSVQLRYLQTLTEIGVEKNTTVVFPVPVDFFSGIQKLLGKPDGAKSE